MPAHVRKSGVYTSLDSLQFWIPSCKPEEHLDFSFNSFKSTDSHSLGTKNTHLTVTNLTDFSSYLVWLLAKKPGKLFHDVSHLLWSFFFLPSPHLG